MIKYIPIYKNVIRIPIKSENKYHVNTENINRMYRHFFFYPFFFLCMYSFFFLQVSCVLSSVFLLFLLILWNTKNNSTIKDNCAKED